MRSAVGIFGMVCGLVVIWTVGSYGYASADDPAAKWNMAFLFGVVATAGLFGHAVALRIWSVNRFWAIVIGLACGLALLINLSNGLGALYGRGSKGAAEVTKVNSDVADDRAELKRLEAQVAKIGDYVPTDEAAVAAAERASTRASERRAAECGVNNEKRGPNCKKFEGEEADALKTLASTTASKAATDRATKIEAEIAPIRERLRKAGPEIKTNIGGNALAKLFRLPDSEAEFAAVAQNFAMAVIVELIIVLCMVAFELLGRLPAASARPADMRTKPEKVDTSAEIRPQLTHIETPVVAAVEPTVPAKPKLVSSNRATISPIPRIMTAALEPAVGQQVDLRAAFARYAADCKAEGTPTVTPDQFMTAMAKFCKGAGIKTTTTDETVLLLDVQLMQVDHKVVKT